MSAREASTGKGFRGGGGPAVDGRIKVERPIAMKEAGAGPDRTVRFGTYELHLGTGELWREGQTVELAPQPTRLLALLARHPGRLVTREQIREEIWGDSVVEFDAAINHAIREIRATLGDHASDPRYIETVPRRGYRLIAEAAEVEEDGPSVAERPGSAATGKPVRRFIWPWVAGMALLLLVLLWLPRNSQTLGVPTVIVAPAQAAAADSPADRLAEVLTSELQSGLRELEPGTIRLIEWSGTVVYDPEARALMRNGENLGVDVVVETSVSVRDDSLQTQVSLNAVATGVQLWHRAFVDPLGDPEGAVARIRERVVDEVRERFVGG